MKKYKKTLLLIINVILVSLFFISCSNEIVSPVKPPPPEMEKIGRVVLINDGKMIASIEKEQVNGIVLAELAKESESIELLFYNDKKELMGYNPENYKLVLNGDSEYATFAKHSDWEFCVFGKKQGNSTFQLIIENGVGVEYSSPEIPLEVKVN